MSAPSAVLARRGATQLCRTCLSCRRSLLLVRARAFSSGTAWRGLVAESVANGAASEPGRRAAEATAPFHAYPLSPPPSRRGTQARNAVVPDSSIARPLESGLEVGGGEAIPRVQEVGAGREKRTREEDGRGGERGLGQEEDVHRSQGPVSVREGAAQVSRPEFTEPRAGSGSKRTAATSAQQDLEQPPSRPAATAPSRPQTTISFSPEPATAQSKQPRPRSRLRTPRKAALHLTPTAVSQLSTLLAAPTPKLIRVGVRNRGCSGLAYNLEYVDKPGAFDETVEQDGVRVLIDSKALFSIIGSEMDWVQDRLSERFVFRNPNIKEQCGCGESFMV